MWEGERWGKEEERQTVVGGLSRIRGSGETWLVTPDHSGPRKPVGFPGLVPSKPVGLPGLFPSLLGPPLAKWVLGA